MRFLLLLLIGTGSFVPPATAPPSVWTTSSALMARSPSAFSRLDRSGIDAVVKRLPRSLSQIPDYLRADGRRVYLHTGDLTVDGSFANDHALVVDGHVTIRGSYDDYRNGIGILVVLGNLRAEHVVSWGSIAVTGSLEAPGLVYAYYNDFTFEVAGPVKARAVVVFDKSTNDLRIEAPVVQTASEAGVGAALRHFVPELMIEDVLDKTDADTVDLQAVASYDAARERVAAGQPIFRDRPGPESLPADVLRLFRPGLAAAAKARLAKTDPLLALIVQRTGAARSR